MNTTTHPVSAQGLCFAYVPGHDAVHDVSLALRRGTVTAIAGPNGSGKSTLIELLAGIHKPRSGTVARHGTVALVVQRPAVPDTLPVTVHDVVTMGTWGRRRRVAAARRRIGEAIDRVGLTGLGRRPFADLSGGQRQRTLLAQGLVRRAEIMLFDEPATGLDAASRQRTREIMSEEATVRGATIACVTHDDDTIITADTVIQLDDGRLVTA